MVSSEGLGLWRGSVKHRLKGIYTTVIYTAALHRGAGNGSPSPVSAPHVDAQP